MLSKVEAYEILGLKQGASQNDIEKRFSILLKKYKMSTIETEEGQSEESINIDEATNAYNVLMGYEVEIPPEPYKKPNFIYKKLGVDEKKARNFFHYHKFHIIISIIALIVIATTVRSCVNRVEPDVNLAFIGNLYYDSEVVKATLLPKLPEFKEIGIDGAYLSPDGKGEQEMAMQTKKMVLLAAGDVDIYILDKANFDSVAKQGAFVNIDKLVETLNIDLEKNKEYIVKTEDEPSSHLYGIDISSSKLLETTKVIGDTKIAAISIRAKNYDKAVKVLKLLLE